MEWATAGWLLGLLPWGGVAVYLLAAAGRPRAVPFLRLWRAAVGVTRRPAGVRRRPPAALVVAVLAVLAAVLAAGGPTAWKGDATAVVVLDRGGDPGGGGFGGLVGRAERRLGGRPARLLCVPAVAATPQGAWAAFAASVPPTAVDTGGELDRAVAAVLRDPGRPGPVLVLTGRPLAWVDPRVVRIAPDRPAGHVGIAALAARERPRPQVMVRLANGSGAARVVVRITTAGATTTREVPLPARGAAADVFVDVPTWGETVSAEVDPQAVDGRAWLAREAGPATVMATPGVPAAVRRMVDVFDRTVGPGRAMVSVSNRPLPEGQAGVWVLDSGPQAAGPATVANHPVTAGVGRWAGGGGAVPAGFTVVARVGGRPVVAVRESPRQVWADLDEAAVSRTADWVVFLAAAFRWAGGGGAEYAWSPPHRLGGGWHRDDDSPAPAGVEPGTWPGLYRDADGRAVAIDAAGGDVAVPVRRAAAVVPAPGSGLGGPLSEIAVGGLAVAAAAWPGRDRRSQAGPQLT